MQIVVLASDRQKEEISNGVPVADVVWINHESEFLQYKNADAFLDLEFINTAERVNLLRQLLPKTVVVNSVVHTLEELDPSFIRINAWDTFLLSSLLEAACAGAELRRKGDEVFASFGKGVQWLPDDAGFVSARVVSMIINEAFLALAESVSTKEEINTAMKLGTAYPYGPFEWGEKIGLQNVVVLLQKLSITQPRYMPAESLMRESLRS